MSTQQQEIQKLLQEIKDNSDKNIKLYTMEHCPACKELKQKLDHLNIKYENVEMSGNEEVWAWLRENNGKDYVPQANVEGKLLNEFEEVNDLVAMIISEMIGRRILIN